LAELPLLGFLKLYGTQVTKEGVEKFRLASGVAVDFRRGAFLGVGGKDGDGGCLIGTVHKGSPADKAGILENDVIVRFGGAEVKSFSSLTDLIAPRQHGEEVEIEIVRDDPTNGTRQVVTVRATLAAWEMETAIQNPRR
jgi:S1-C subfamily serine protease